MTDKELKKLSRLELLELLLTESRENERIKDELEKAKQENSVEKSAQHLNEITDKFEAALHKLSSLVTLLEESDEKDHTATLIKIDSDAPLADSEDFVAEDQENETTIISGPDDTVTPDNDVIVSSDVYEEIKSESPDRYVDFNIYKQLIIFFITSPESLDVLPEDLRRTVSSRIEEIMRK